MRSVVKKGIKDIVLPLVLVLLSLYAHSQQYKNVEYTKIGNRKLLADIYLPESDPDPYLVIWVHGGAWHSGSKEDPPKGFVENGYAMASIAYRLSGEAPFPAMIHDIKAAIRYLRANAKKYGYRADKVIIAGSSAGGHLAALVGMTNGHKELEGAIGNYTSTSSTQYRA